MAVTIYNPSGVPINVVNTPPPVDQTAEVAALNQQIVDLKAQIPPPPPPPPPTGLVPLITTGLKYRNQQKYLFQTVRQAMEPARIAGTVGFANEGTGAILTVGPTAKFVDRFASWPWDRVGGDYLDKNLARNSLTTPAPWFQIKTDAVGNDTVKTYTADCTECLQYIQRADRWNALLLQGGASTYRNIATTFSNNAPYMSVVYADGTVDILKCRIVAYATPGTDYARTTQADEQCPVFVEFERPGPMTNPVRSASLTVTVTHHFAGPYPQISAFVLDPPMNTDPVELGVAATAELDSKLAFDPSVIGVHRYVDGTKFSDFSMGAVPPGIFPANGGGYNTSSEDWFDPAIYGNGPQNLKMLPHHGLGKWLNTNIPVPPDPAGFRSTWELVRSDYQNADGFAPLAPGLGAMRIFMPGRPDLMDGITEFSALGYGTTGAVIYLPENLWGIDELFVRYYARLGSPLGDPYRAPLSKRFQVVIGGAPIWTEMTGKFGIMPTHDNTYGGFSGSAGGPYGWQWRQSMADITHDDTGPDLGGISLGIHTFDFNYRGPKGYNIGATDTPADSGFGQRGGLGGVMYALHWYCIETRVKLNTIMDAAPGFLPDGEAITWIDGRMVNRRTGLCLRSGPIYNPGYVKGVQRPIRNLGHRNLLLNWFHGGKTQNSFDRSCYITGLAYGTKRLGPMMVAA